MTTLVVGRGLLGGALVRVLTHAGLPVATVEVPWSDPDVALERLAEAAQAVAGLGPTWRLAWCAGAGVVATSAETLAAEVELFRGFIDGLSAPPEVAFLASSAGGVYAGSPDLPPYTENSRTGALAPYGHAKLEMEQVIAGLAGRGTRVLIGRIANLYGPGQNLDKAQGMISQLCLAWATRKPIGVYVSLDTLRDYLYAPDAALMIRAALARTAAEPPGTVVVKILASGRAVSIGGLLGDTNRVLRRRPQVAFAPPAAGQVRDLRVRSMVWPDLDGLARTSLVSGLRATAEDIYAQVRSGRMQRLLLR